MCLSSFKQVRLIQSDNFWLSCVNWSVELLMYDVLALLLRRCRIHFGTHCECARMCDFWGVSCVKVYWLDLTALMSEIREFPACPAPSTLYRACAFVWLLPYVDLVPAYFYIQIVFHMQIDQSVPLIIATCLSGSPWPWIALTIKPSKACAFSGIILTDNTNRIELSY